MPFEPGAVSSTGGTLKHVLSLLLIVLSLTGGLGSWTAAPAAGALISYQFNGTVDDISPSLYTSCGSGTNGFDVGLKLTGHSAFQTSTPVNLAYPPPQPILAYTMGFYANSVTSLQVSLGTYTPGPHTVGYNSSSVTNGDLAAYGASHQVTEDADYGILPLYFSLNFFDSKGTAFSSVELPGPRPPSIASFDSRQWSLLFHDGSTVSGPLNSLSPVPLPSTGLLFGVALTASAVWRCVRSSQFSVIYA